MLKHDPSNLDIPTGYEWSDNMQTQVLLAVVLCHLTRHYMRCVISNAAYTITNDIFDPTDPRSNSKGPAAAALSSLLEQGWRFAFTDGSGLEGHATAGVFSAGEEAT